MFVQKQKQGWCVTKKYCASYKVKKEKYADYEDLLFKYSTNGKLKTKPLNLATSFDFRLYYKAFTFCPVWFCSSKIWN